MKKVFSFILTLSFLSLNIAPVLADEYISLPPIMDDETVQDIKNSGSSYSKKSAPLKGSITTVPVGTAFQILTDTEISSKTNSVGEIFTATLNQPITMNGYVIIPGGRKS